MAEARNREDETRQDGRKPNGNGHDGRDDESGAERRGGNLIIEPDPLPGPGMDPAKAADFAKEIVKELFDCLKAAEANVTEDTRLFFPEGISSVNIRLKAGGGTAPAIDLEFTVSGNAG